MNAKATIRTASDLSMMVVRSYLSDLSDAELLRRVAPGCNHVAWQLGHLIAANCRFVAEMSPEHAVPLPEGFADRYTNETTADDDPSHFLGRDEYLSLLEQSRQALLSAIDATPDEQLDGENPREAFRGMCPTLGSMYLLVLIHPMMHAGQFVPLRRTLGKPIVI